MADLENQQTETGAIAEVLRELSDAEVFSIERGSSDVRSVLVLPEGKSVHSIKEYLDEYLPAPERKRGTAKLTTLQSFVDHANRFKAAHSAVFAVDNMESPALISVLDYHEEQSGSAHFGEHRGFYQFPVSDEWKAWMAVNGRELSQKDFAEVLEDRIGDVADMTGASERVWSVVEKLGVVLAAPNELLALSRGLSIYVNSKIAHHTNLATGEGRLQFETEHRDQSGSPLKIPGGFALAIPVFRGGASYRICVRLRYSVREGRVFWKLALYRPDLSFRDAFDEACKEVVEKTQLPLFVGSPEPETTNTPQR